MSGGCLALSWCALGSFWRCALALPSALLLVGGRMVAPVHVLGSRWQSLLLCAIPGADGMPCAAVCGCVGVGCSSAA
jgi:hypothetical protein